MCLIAVTAVSSELFSFFGHVRVCTRVWASVCVLVYVLCVTVCSLCLRVFVCVCVWMLVRNKSEFEVCEVAVLFVGGVVVFVWLSLLCVCRSALRSTLPRVLFNSLRH